MGTIIATVIWLVLMLISFAGGDKILLATSKARKVTHDVHPQLFNIVEEMTIASNLPKVPDIYIINDPAPNAFATGRSPQTASVAVTAGLLARLNRDELQGVIAHEISHVLHRDILFVTLAGVMLGSIVLISQVFLRSMFYGSMTGSRRRTSSRGQGGGQAQLLFLVIAIICAILAPVLANILYFSLSRKREYLADAGAVRLTRYPDGLASALEKISRSDVKLDSANKVTAPMYISNPLKGRKAASLFATHPPIDKRIKTLRNMSRGASFNDYSDSYSQTVGGAVMPAAALKEDSSVQIRSANAESKAQANKKKQTRQVNDIMRRVNQFAFLTCMCGLKMKIPPNFKAKNVKCPRCGKVSPVKGGSK
ncbi:MAG: peptidase M28 [Chloroflexi bacterium]|nr:MAG: peptidase M28 [Chloroflexota bacterium]